MKHFILEEKLLYLKQQDLKEIEDISTDYLVTERAENVTMIKANFDWMDVGTWNSVLELSRMFSKKSLHLASLQHMTRKTGPVFTTEGHARNLLSRDCKQQGIPNKSLISCISRIIY